MRQMRMESAPTCPVCGNKGLVAFESMIDHMFNVEGTFDLRRCNDVICATLWMDPRPIEEDIHLAYSEYYTHTKSGGARPNNALRGILRFARNSAEGVTGLRFQRERITAMYLDETSRGRLLDVGCGSCLRLEHLRSLGWDVMGQDVDPAVQQEAEKRQIPIYVGPLPQANLADRSFDAVVSSHAIEHMHDPRAILRECYRILKPGGTLVFITPNSRSASIDRFDGDWAGLDAPRHLVIFSANSLANLAHQVGFDNVQTWTTNVRTSNISLQSDYFQQVARANQRLARRNSLSVVVREMVRQYWKALTEHDAGATGEECVLRAIR